MRVKFFVRFLFVLFLLLTACAVTFYIYKNNRIASYETFFQKETMIAQKIFEEKKDQKLPNVRITEKDRIHLLVIDGGGAKGIYALRVLEYIEKQTNKPISDLYDVIGGTSVGSLLAFTLSIPGEKGPKHSAENLIPIFKKISSQNLQPNFSHKILSGFGLFSPLIENQTFIQKLREETGDFLLSECLNHIIIYGYNLNSNEIILANNRSTKPNSVNPVGYQFIGGTTSPYGIAPANRLILKSGSEPQLVADAAAIIDDPLLAVILTTSAQYPNKKLLVTHISLTPRMTKPNPNFPFYEGKLAGLEELGTMIVEGRNELIRDYIEILSRNKLYAFDSLVTIGVKEDNQWLNIDPFDFSLQNLTKIDEFAKTIIENNKEKLDQVVEELLKD